MINDDTNNGSFWSMGATDYGIRPQVRHLVLLGPAVITLIQASLMAIPATRAWSLTLLEENHLFEMLTFALLFVAGILGMSFSWVLRQRGESFWVYGFYVFFSLGLLFIAMEEIAWGQWFFGFETPERWQAINQQGETTLHNISGLQGHSEWMRLLFGLGGLCAIVLSRTRSFKRLGMPLIVVPCLLIIVSHASLDVFNDFVPLTHQFDYMVQRSSEFIEFLISVAALSYLWLNRRQYVKVNA